MKASFSYSLQQSALSEQSGASLRWFKQQGQQIGLENRRSDCNQYIYIRLIHRVTITHIHATAAWAVADASDVHMWQCHIMRTAHACTPWTCSTSAEPHIVCCSSRVTVVAHWLSSLSAAPQQAAACLRQQPGRGSLRCGAAQVSSEARSDPQRCPEAAFTLLLALVRDHRATPCAQFPSGQSTFAGLVSRFLCLDTFLRATRLNTGLPGLAGDLSIEVAECGEGGGRQLQAARDIEPGQTLLSVPFPAVFIDQVGFALRRPFSRPVFLFFLLYAPTPQGLGS